MEKSLEDYPIYLSVADVAKILGVSGITVRRMIREKKLTTVRVGRLYRIPKGKLLEYLSAN